MQPRPPPPLLPHGWHHDLWGGLSWSSEDGHALRPQTEPSTALLHAKPLPRRALGVGEGRSPKDERLGLELSFGGYN